MFVLAACSILMILFYHIQYFHGLLLYHFQAEIEEFEAIIAKEVTS